MWKNDFLDEGIQCGITIIGSKDKLVQRPLNFALQNRPFDHPFESSTESRDGLINPAPPPYEKL